MSTPRVWDRTVHSHPLRIAICFLILGLLALAGPAAGALILPDGFTISGSSGIPTIGPNAFSREESFSSAQAAEKTWAVNLSPASAKNLEQRIEQTLHGFQYNEETGTWFAVNYAQQSSIRRDSTGVVSITSANGSFGMQLAAAGRTERYRLFGPGTARGDGRTLAIVRAGYTEWYLNGNNGIEQGMDITARPSGTGPLRIVFTISGNLTPSLDGQDLVFSDAEGPVFRYSGLAAQDTRGNDLPARLILTGNTLVWEIDDTVAVYPVRIDPLVTQVRILSASDKADSNFFGYSVAVDGTTAIVGAPYANSGGTDRGQAYIFYKDQGGADTWGQVRILTASDAANSDDFGVSVAVDGSTAVVGANLADPDGHTDAGKAYVFYKDKDGADTWGQVRILSASDKADGDYFGYSVAVDGTTAIVGAPYADSGGYTNAGKAYVFYKDQGSPDNWGQVAILSASDKADWDLFGYSVAVDGTTAIVGAIYANSGGTDRGQAYIFYKDQDGADKWGQVAILSASDKADADCFGYSVAVDGTTAIVGAPYANSGGTDRGQAYIFSFYGAPTFTGIAPATGTNDNAAAAVTITGTNYYGTPVVTLKKAGEADITATGVTITGDTTIDCSFDLTGAATGAWDIEITNPDAQAVTGAGAFVVSLPVPVVTFTGTPTTGTHPLLVQFNETSTNSPTTWNWSFGDGSAWFNTTLAAQRNATHTYTTAGTYTVTLIANNTDGSGTLTRAGYIFSLYGAPTFTGIAPATGTNDNAAAAVTITGTNYYGTPVVTLKKAGEADITATGVTITGDTTIDCSFDLTGAATGAWDIEITNPDAQAVTGAGAFVVSLPVPVVTFTGTPTTGTHPLLVQFNETSTNSPTTWNWSFGDGSAWFNTTLAAQRNATHTYTTGGTYTVTLIANNTGGSGTLTRAGFITVTTPQPNPPVPPDNPPSSDPGDGSSSDSGPAISAPSISLVVNIGGNSAAGSALVTGTGINDLIVTGMTETGSDIPLPPGTVYQYIGLVPARFTTITAAAISFTVPAAWLEEHAIPPQNIVLYHFTGGAWVALPTTVSGTQNGIVTFTATSPGFSLFAIAGTPGTPETPAVRTIGDLAAGSGPAAEGKPGPQAPVVTQTTAAPAPAHGQDPDIPLPLLAIAGLVILAAGGFLARRWWIRRQNPALFREYD